MKNQFEKSAKTIWSDNGSKCTSELIKKFYIDKEIIYQTSCVEADICRVERRVLTVAYSPNGVWKG